MQHWLVLLEDGEFPRVASFDTLEELTAQLSELYAGQYHGFVYVFHGQRWLTSTFPRHLLTPNGPIPLFAVDTFAPDLSGAVGHPEVVDDDLKLTAPTSAAEAEVEEEGIDSSWNDEEAEGDLGDDEENLFK